MADDTDTEGESVEAQEEKEGEEGGGTETGAKPQKQRKGERLRKVRVPECRHGWCLGERLRAAGLESGVCCPRPLPWARAGRLRYLPGWEELCQRYDCAPLRYRGRRGASRTEDQACWDQELAEARLLWAYLGPVLRFPGRPVYEDPMPRKMCRCPANCCARNPPELRALQGPQPSEPQPGGTQPL